MVIDRPVEEVQAYMSDPENQENAKLGRIIMATDMSDTSPIACRRDTGAFDLEESERYKSLREGMRSAFQGMKELPDGFAFRFPSDPAVIVNLAEFITLERRCCSFFNFALGVEPDDGPVWLSLTGGEGVKEFLQTEISAHQA